MRDSIFFVYFLYIYMVFGWLGCWVTEWLGGWGRVLIFLCGWSGFFM